MFADITVSKTYQIGRKKSIYLERIKLGTACKRELGECLTGESWELSPNIVFLI